MINIDPRNIRNSEVKKNWKLNSVVFELESGLNLYIKDTAINIKINVYPEKI